MLKTFSAFIIISMLTTFAVHSISGVSEEQTAVKTLREVSLPEFPGKVATMIEVRYPPGGSDPIHRHDAHALVYMLEGEVEMKLQDQDPVRLRPGDTFYEDPKAIHLVGRNLSDTKEARFIVVLIKEKDAPILTPITASSN